MEKLNLLTNIRAILMLVVSIAMIACNSQKNYGGLALYTVREEMAEFPQSTIAEIADAGYQYVEAAGYEDGKFYGMDPLDFKAFLQENNLDPVSSHHGGVNFENADQMMKDAKAAGFEYFVVPVPPQGLFRYNQEKNSIEITGTAEDFAAILDELGKKAAGYGLQLLYHNHNFEFEKEEEGIILYDYLLQNTDPEYVNFEMDLYWTVKAGADPVAYFTKYPGRFIIWHVKDMDDEGNFAPVGEGNIDFERILAEKDKSGMKYYFVEQDATFDLEPLEAIRKSRQGLRKYGFE